MEGARNQSSGFGVRLGAASIDGLIVGVASGFVGIALGAALIGTLIIPTSRSIGPSGELSDEATAIVTAVVVLGVLLIVSVIVVLQWVYYVLFTGLRGQTPGKKVVGIKVVGPAREVTGIGRTFMREVVGKLISYFAFYIGYLWVLWDADRQAWHDKLARTYVVPVQRSS